MAIYTGAQLRHNDFRIFADPSRIITYNCDETFKTTSQTLCWSIKNSGEILNKLKSRGFLASGLSTYDFSTLYTTLPHNLIKEKLTELIEQTFNR